MLQSQHIKSNNGGNNMSKTKSADLILKLYDLRREETMRKARNWFFMFDPQSADDIERTMMDPEVGGYLRMVLSYWDMAGSLVRHEAIDADMFNDTNGEHIGVYAKIEPFLSELRAKWDMPDAFENLEKVVLDRKDGAERVKKTQEWAKSIREQIAAAQAG
jgi:hypothetical protein